MAKDFVRHIMNTDETEPKETNRVGDLLTDEKGNAWIRTKGGAELYHELTDNIKSLTSGTPDILKITSAGKNARKLSVELPEDLQGVKRIGTDTPGTVEIVDVDDEEKKINVVIPENELNYLKKDITYYYNTENEPFLQQVNWYKQILHIDHFDTVENKRVNIFKKGLINIDNNQYKVQTLKIKHEHNTSENILLFIPKNIFNGYILNIDITHQIAFIDKQDNSLFLMEDNLNDLNLNMEQLFVNTKIDNYEIGERVFNDEECYFIHYHTMDNLDKYIYNAPIDTNNDHIEMNISHLTIEYLERV